MVFFLFRSRFLLRRENFAGKVGNRFAGERTAWRWPIWCSSRLRKAFSISCVPRFTPANGPHRQVTAFLLVEAIHLPKIHLSWSNFSAQTLGPDARWSKPVYWDQHQFVNRWNRTLFVMTCESRAWQLVHPQAILARFNRWLAALISLTPTFFIKSLINIVN